MSHYDIRTTIIIVLKYCCESGKVLLPNHNIVTQHEKIGLKQYRKYTYYNMNRCILCVGFLILGHMYSCISNSFGIS